MGEAISLHAATSLVTFHSITNPNNTKIFRTNHSTLPQTCSVWSSQSFPQTHNQKVLGTLATTSQHSAKLQVLPRFSRSLAKKNGRAHSPLGPADSNRINKLQTCKKPILGKMSWSWNEVPPFNTNFFEFSDILSLIIAPNSRLRLPLGSRSHSPRRAPAPAPQRLVLRHWKEVFMWPPAHAQVIRSFIQLHRNNQEATSICLTQHTYQSIDALTKLCYDRTWKAHPLKA